MCVCRHGGGGGGSRVRGVKVKSDVGYLLYNFADAAGTLPEMSLAFVVAYYHYYYYCLKLDDTNENS